MKAIILMKQGWKFVRYVKNRPLCLLSDLFNAMTEWVNIMNKQLRAIVKIDEDKCTGCGLCVPDCAEGAIKIINGKAKLMAENLCDGLGNCLGVCPEDAITIEERPADDFDLQAVENFRAQAQTQKLTTIKTCSDTSEKPDKLPCGCPGTMMRKLSPAPVSASACPGEGEDRPSRLSQFPVQLSLLPVAGSMWEGAHLLLAADCVGFVMPDFHEKLLAGTEKTLAVACPKLDDISEYVEKLTIIFANNDIKSITVAHMEVPCCTGIVIALKQALENANREDIPVKDVMVGINGKILEEE